MIPGPRELIEIDAGAPRARLAAAVRALQAAVLDSADADETTRIADQVLALVSRLSAERAEVPAPMSLSDYFRANNPASGPFNPIAPPVRIWPVWPPGPGYPELRGEVTFSRLYQGPPASVHGGVVALVLDDSLGTLNSLAGLPGFTGTLEVRYHQPAPVDTPLQVGAQVKKAEGRKVFSWAGLFTADTLLAEANAVFVRPRQLTAAQGER